MKPKTTEHTTLSRRYPSASQPRIAIALSALAALAIMPAEGTVIASYTFTGSSLASNDSSLDSTASNFIASGFTSSFDTTNGNAAPSLAITTSSTGPLGGGTGELTEANAISNEDYYSFTITPTLDPGDSLDFTSFTFDVAGRNSNSNSRYVLRASTDSYATTLGVTGTVSLASDPSTWVSQNFTLSDDSILQGVTAATTFRLYLIDNRGSTAHILIDNVIINATTVPEPGAALLGAVGFIALLRRRRV
jgi:hypothetical protein